MKSNKDNKKTYLAYTGLFALISLFIIAYLVFNGKSNINTASDGMNQHYRALLYYSRYLKQIVKDLFAQHQLIMPHWSHTIGEGADIISTLHSDAVGDPLTFLSVLVPEKLMPAFYLFNAFIRVYLAGFFFIKLCLYLGNRNSYGLVAGSLVYAFGYWSLESITHHIYFLTPLMLMPLLILGVEKILNDEEPFTFTAAVCWGAVSWLYFFYMEAAATAIYVAIRLITRYGKDLKTLFKKLVKIAVHAVLGVLLAAAVLAPMAYTYLNDKRMGIENIVSLLYPRFFYERLLTFFVSNDSAYDLCLGFVAPAALTLVLSLKDIRKDLGLALVNIVTFVALCLPICGKILNGFSFVSLRWSFAVALPVAYTLVKKWDGLKEEKLTVGITWLAMAAFCAYSAWSRNERVIVPLILCLAFAGVALSKLDKEVMKKDLRQVLMIALIVVNIIYIEEYSLSPRGGNVINDLLTWEKADALTSSSEAYVMKGYLEENESGFYRYTGNRQTNNAAMLFDVPSTNFYWSITNSADQIFRLKLGLKDYISWQINGYDERAALESLSNVKYYIASKSYEGLLPYGFVKKDQIDNRIIYVNEHVLPFGYTYEDSLSYEKWDELDELAKQEVMLDQIIIDDGSDTIKNEPDITYLSYTLECDDGIAIQGSKLDVSKADACLHIRFEGIADREHYLILNGIAHEDTYKVIEDDHTSSIMKVTASNGYETYFSHITRSNHYYFGKSDYVTYFGNGEALNEITISFPLVGEYSYTELKVAEIAMDDYAGKIDALAKEHLEDVEFAANKVSGSIDLSTDKYLLVSIPYHKGWTAKVDGQTVEVLCADQHYIGLKLEKGHHEIELHYETPGLKIGCIVTGLSLLGTLAYLIVYRKRNK